MTSPDQTVLARHYATRQPVEVSLEAGRIARLAPTLQPGPDHLWVAPGLVDLQINGYAGIDFQRDGLTREDLHQAAIALATDGCRRWLLTLITDEWSRLMARLRHVRQLRAGSKELQGCLVGWHIEGPFLSDQPGFAGAHRAGVMCDPTPDHMQELADVVGKDPVLITLAPEREGSMEAIQAAVELGFRVSLGHCNASAETMERAMAAGATGFTHLGNGCPRELDRHDNIIWRVLDHPDLRVGLIVDGIHVTPPLFRLVHKAHPAAHLYYTTDAMAAAGAPPGRYTLGLTELEVGPDQVVRQPGSSLFAGSALRPVEGIRRAAQMLGRDWQEVWDHFSAVPAAWMGLPPGLEEGQPADLVLVGTDSENSLRTVQTP